MTSRKDDKRDQSNEKLPEYDRKVEARSTKEARAKQQQGGQEHHGRTQSHRGDSGK